MSVTHSIIVYRNPAEAALWEGGMIFPLICGMFVSIILSTSVALLLQKYTPKFKYITELTIFVAVASLVSVMAVMQI